MQYDIGHDHITSMLEAAIKTLDTLRDGKRHTVAAAVMTEEEYIYTGINMYHFTGGPCAEVSAISSMILANKHNPAAILAIGDLNRGVMPPCGRCRQMLLDYFPDIQVVIANDETFSTRSIRELLPDAFSAQ